MKQICKKSAALLMVLVLLAGLFSVSSLTIAAAVPTDYTYFMSATEGKTTSTQKIATTDASGYYALRNMDNSAVGDGTLTFQCKNSIEAYNFKTLVSNVAGYNGTWTFYASKDKRSWDKLTPTTEKESDFPNPGWNAGYYNNYGTLKKSDGYKYLRAAVEGNTAPTHFPSIAGVAYTSDPAEEDISSFKGTDISMGLGSTATERGFSWQATMTQKNGAVKIVESSKMNGKKFPADARIVKGTATPTTNGYHIKVTVSGLKPNTEYAYACGDSTYDVWSTPYTFKVDDTTKGYKAIFVGDPQVGAGITPATDGDNFEVTLYRANKIASDAAFVLCPGDQVDYGGADTYSAVLSPPQLKKWAFAPTVGNHEYTGEMKQYYYMPNQTGLGATLDASDYYFSYGNTLYVVLNGSNSNVQEHKQALEKAIKSHPDATWRVVMFHEDVYGFGTHAFAPEGSNYSSAYLRRTLVPILDEFDIDLVLNGHDHYYTRSKFMKNQQPVTTNKTAQDGGFIKPEGTLYITGGCSSDSKYYNVAASIPNWVEKVCTEKIKTFSVIEVTDNSLSVKTYFGDNTTGLVDEVTIYQKAPSTSSSTKPAGNTTASTTGNKTTQNSSATTSSSTTENITTITGSSTSASSTTTVTDLTTKTNASTGTLGGMASSTAPTTAVNADQNDEETGDFPWAWCLLIIPVVLIPAAIMILNKRKNKAK